MRRSGILLPVSSLPSRFGIGGMGKSARDFADTLAAAGQSVWQVLPLNIPDFVHSPYASPSAFAGNPMLIDPAELVSDGLLTESEIEALAGVPTGTADYVRADAVKGELLRRAYARFSEDGTPRLREDFSAFLEREASWLADFALFDAIKEREGGKPFWAWQDDLKNRRPEAMEAARSRLSEEIRCRCFWQFLFQRQLNALRAYLAARGISLLGDIPFYVASDSADVWAHPELFSAEEVAGVPPDFFTADGQLWGNPIYNWERMREDGYAWWMQRLARCTKLYDETRLDHFRAFDSYYVIPKGAKDARSGTWRPGEGRAFFDALRKALPELTLIAEDLGDSPPSVGALREYAAVPGMRILQFAFGSDGRNPFLPHNYGRDTVVYLGTHDNDTTAGFFASAAPGDRARAASYLGIPDGADIPTFVRGMMRAASASVADTVIFTVQDLLSEGSAGRINTPGKIGGCWEYALSAPLTRADTAYLCEITALYGRTNLKTSEEKAYG